MVKYSFEEVKRKLNELVSVGFEPELTLYIYEKEYMIIAYEAHCSFQRCGFNNGSREVNYNNLDDLYNAETVDNILLKRDWNDIEDFNCFDFELYYSTDN